MARIQRMRHDITPSLVIASIALFLAVGGAGAGAYAATQLPANSVGTRQLQNQAVGINKLSPSARLRLMHPGSSPAPQFKTLTVEKTVSSAPGVLTSSQALCPANYVAIGGGVLSEGMTVEINAPGPTGISWVGEARGNADGGNSHLTTRVICTKGFSMIGRTSRAR